MPALASARYGKDNVRVFKVHRDGSRQTVTEMTVCCLLEGSIDTSYTMADNSVVVATDSIKNTIYIKAKEHPVDPPELFASLLGSHFLDTYAHITAANVRVVVHRWTRMDIDGKPHPHSFLRDGEETRVVDARVARSSTATATATATGAGGHDIDITSGIQKLTVLKSTGSAFHGFVRDEYTTLPETWDRILSTDVDASWTWSFPGVAGAGASGGLPAVQGAAAAAKFDDAWHTARNVTLKMFAEDDSASVQNTMYKMCQQILDAVPDVRAVSYQLPNKHYFEIDLSWHKGLKNTGKDAEVYAPQSGPNGLIKCEVVRSKL